MNTHPSRIVIYSSDVSAITGMKPDTARKLLGRIRKKLGKDIRAPVTLYEFCEHMRFHPDWVLPFLKH